MFRDKSGLIDCPEIITAIKNTQNTTLEIDTCIPTYCLSIVVILQ